MYNNVLTASRTIGLGTEKIIGKLTIGELCHLQHLLQNYDRMVSYDELW